MASIDDIIKREVNPFDLINIKPTNFWEEKHDSALTVDSIHQEAITEIEGILNLVAIDHRSRSILLVGDPGSGKSHLLARLKYTLNTKAFFAYILCDWSDSGNIWRHILRYTIDSLIQVPEKQQESQLMIWLKSLSAFTKRNLKQRIFNDSIWNLLQSDRQKFIRHLKDTYKQARIYNPDVFFGILHDLTNPELYPLACEWLKGDELSEESMQILKLKNCIDTEDAAKNILANFGKISTETQPIVLCFDNLDTMPKLSDGLLDIQPFFDVNTTIHGENLKNFIVIISVITQTWRLNINRIQQADRAGIHKLIQLKYITLEQAEALWAYLLKSLHQKAEPQPQLKIFPLTQQLLQENFPGGKTKPRTVLDLGKQEYQKYKFSLFRNKKIVIISQQPEEKLAVNPGTIKIKIEKKDSIETPTINEKEREQAEFQLIWQQEYKKVQSKIAKISLLAASELIRMVQETLEALQAQAIKPKLISGKFASYSLSYQSPYQRENIGIVWTEDAHMNSFYNVMNACQKMIQQNLCQTLYLIRIGSIGNAKLAGHQIYSQIFTGTKHVHIKPNLSSVHYLATYHSLVNSALAQELVIAGKTITLQKLQSLIRESKTLDKCTLLQDLGLVPKEKPDQDDGNVKKEDLRPVKDFLLNLIKTQGFMGVPTLIKQSAEQFPSVKESDVHFLIELLCQEKKVKLINPKDKLQDQLICLIA